MDRCSRDKLEINHGPDAEVIKEGDTFEPEAEFTYPVRFVGLQDGVAIAGVGDYGFGEVDLDTGADYGTTWVANFEPREFGELNEWDYTVELESVEWNADQDRWDISFAFAEV
ncbi:hypothetical protein [Methanonatronarchaeum sp. AMET6-2]|uniref:hypothetical protein n=1 Tax=Methanonatronarchaeum sp. AMET6-2 TaxID=2933293 RepID=UPI001FF5FEE8|nr:hypothetical protein [Methanonatronarchaeum sp. AMET6-2]UOY09392.1 hypothetical protein MU439_03830 [Methanonatronarchaeum sp. AMET6-2]